MFRPNVNYKTFSKLSRKWHQGTRLLDICTRGKIEKAKKIRLDHPRHLIESIIVIVMMIIKWKWDGHTVQSSRDVLSLQCNLPIYPPPSSRSPMSSWSAVSPSSSTLSRTPCMSLPSSSLQIVFYCAPGWVGTTVFPAQRPSHIRLCSTNADVLVQSTLHCVCGKDVR